MSETRDQGRLQQVREILSELSDELERDQAYLHWPQNVTVFVQRIAALREVCDLLTTQDEALRRLQQELEECHKRNDLALIARDHYDGEGREAVQRPATSSRRWHSRLGAGARVCVSGVGGVDAGGRVDMVSAPPRYAPGPWELDESSVHDMWTDSLTVVMPDGGAVCYTTRGLESYQEPDLSAGERSPAFATARLIAAAPDLLVALKTAVETIRAFHDIGVYSKSKANNDAAWTLYQSSPEMQAINAAIAKAEGR